MRLFTVIIQPPPMYQPKVTSSLGWFELVPSILTPPTCLCFFGSRSTCPPTQRPRLSYLDSFVCKHCLYVSPNLDAYVVNQEAHEEQEACSLAHSNADRCNLSLTSLITSFDLLRVAKLTCTIYALEFLSICFSSSHLY
jgi:hypothetical protein